MTDGFPFQLYGTSYLFVNFALTGLLSLCPLSFEPFLALLGAERFNALSHILVSVEVALGHVRRLRHCVKIHDLLLSQDLVNGLVNTLLCLLRFVVSICQETVSVRLSCGFFLHVRCALSAGVYSRIALPAG